MQNNYSDQFITNQPSTEILKQNLTSEIRKTAESRRPLTGEVASIDVDASGFVTAWSLTAERLYGFEQDEIIGKHISALYCVGDLLNGRAAYELNATRSRGKYCVSGWQQRKNGQEFWSYSESKTIDSGYRIYVMEFPPTKATSAD